jgi:hypothetical protein
MELVIQMNQERHREECGGSCSTTPMFRRYYKEKAYQAFIFFM